MKPKWNKSWIAGALVAACVLAVVCFAALPEEGQFAEVELAPGQVRESGQPDAAQDAAVAPSEDGLQSEPQDGDPFGGQEYEGGTVLVTLPLGISPAEALAMISEETGIEGLALAEGEDAPDRAVTAAEARRLVKLAIPADVSVSDAVDLIGSSSGADAVQPNFVYYLQDDSPSDSESSARAEIAAQNLVVQDFLTQAVDPLKDTYRDNQWMLESIYAYGTSSDTGYAWNEQTVDGAVTVAVIDESFQASHPDLRDNVRETYNAVNGTTDVSGTAAGKGHGTHVAGIVAATTNEIGVAGVSHNAKLLLIKGANEEGKFDTQTLAKAFAYAVSKKDEYKLRVINMSVGAKYADVAPSRWPQGLNWKDAALINAIDDATAAGVAVVCSGGNSDSSRGWTVPFVDYPADYKNVISVLNLERIGGDSHNVRRNASSNYNMDGISKNSGYVGGNIAAPGTGVYSTYPEGYTSSDVSGTVVADGYGTNTGTSMAAPCVSGVLALVFAKNPSLSVAEATSLLYSTATDVEYANGAEVAGSGWDRYTGYGEVNAYRAVVAADAYISGGTSVQVGKDITLSTSQFVQGWSSSNESVATVSNGVVHGVSGGTARISARLGWLTLYQDVTVYDPSLSGATSVEVGSTAKVTLSCSSSGSWKWTSSGTGAVALSESGTTCTVTGQKDGTVTLRATLRSNSDIWVERQLTVTKASLSNATITFPSSNVTYNGAEQKLTPTVKVGSVTLTAPADYTLVYSGDYTNAGLKAVTVKAADGGRCAGSKAASYAIARRPATITANSRSKAYDGTALTATAVGYSSSGFVKSADLSRVTLSGSIVNAGTATAAISYQLAANMAQNYSVTTKNGTLEVTRASLSNATVTLSPSSYTYDGSAKTPAVTVKVGARTLTQGTDYTVSWPSGRANLGIYQVTVVGKGNYTGSKSATFTVSAARQTLYRLYNPKTDEHHYTLSAYERDVCTSQWGWNYEGIAWYCPSVSSTPVYRLYSPSLNLHHYTTSAYERDVCASQWGWNYEGIAWYSDDAKGAQLYRLYHPGTNQHHYTLSAYERDVCTSQWGWNYEGIAWYGLK